VVDDTGRVVKVCVSDCASGTVYLVTWNGHGDALALWRQNADGTVTLANGYTYDSWGAPTTTVAGGFSDLGFRFLYVGAQDVQWDNSFGLGLLYMHARSYSPGLGRFIQPDPVGSESNLYGYARQNPQTNSDPQGQICLVPVAGWIVCGYAAWAVLTAGVAVIWGGWQFVTHLPRVQTTCYHGVCVSTGPAARTAPVRGSNWVLLRKLSKWELKWVEEQLGEDVHSLKGRRSGSRDLWVRPDGEVVILGRGGKGQGEEVGVNLRDRGKRSHRE